MTQNLGKKANKKANWLLFGAAAISMGMSMPSCPGQQAMQQQVESLQSSQGDLNKKLQNQEMLIKSLSQKIEQTEQLLGQMTGAIQAQRAALEQVNVTVKELQTRATAAASHAAPAKAKALKKKGR